MHPESPESIPNQDSLVDGLIVEKNEHQWPLQIDLSIVEKQVGRWATTQRELDGFQLEVTDISKPHATLELYRDERTDYRFNLSSQNPMLFVVLDSHEETSLTPIMVTASQAVAGSFMDGDYLVLSKPIPLPIQAWMEAFIGRHGELLEVRRKKRKGAGRSSGQ
ncbi:DUF3305 domain-containing protein [Vibrio barjaei]|jgi:hypothetical protein|uniref:DUF3305 domain-containing protein n=1 Tax=Vibrio barjaei TaxID=1676683 RepID=UPI002284B2B4|nr:DUF3305 domain-containing protein [Vibrio barjaei]MCG9786970.1 DUF3305 domain-containing protein [Vibrio mediterranei]MCY9874098.1 DUF3305 domain-containing protein [Vibrio barjaei]